MRDLEPEELIEYEQHTPNDYFDSVERNTAVVEFMMQQLEEKETLKRRVRKREDELLTNTEE